MALVWFVVVFIAGMIVWRFRVHDKNSRKRDDEK